MRLIFFEERRISDLNLITMHILFILICLTSCALPGLVFFLFVWIFNLLIYLILFPDSTGYVTYFIQNVINWYWICIRRLYVSSNDKYQMILWWIVVIQVKSCFLSCTVLFCSVLSSFILSCPAQFWFCSVYFYCFLWMILIVGGLTMRSPSASFDISRPSGKLITSFYHIT